MPAPLNDKPTAEPLPHTSGIGTILDGRYLPPPEDKDGKRWVRTSALILASAEELYSAWHNVEAIQLWQEEIQSVVKTGPSTTHWVKKSGDKTIEWDSEMLSDEPGKRIAWRSTDGEPENAGEVVFEAAPSGKGTVVTVLQEFKIGVLASALQTLAGRNPKQAVIENLRHFKALVESGEIPRTQGQPHGPRGTIGDRKEALYGETIPTPPGENGAVNGR